MHLLKPPIAIPIFLLLSLANTGYAADSRFSGSASLAKPTDLATSAGGQFSLRSEVIPVPVAQSANGLDMIAKLEPDPTAIATTCGPVNDLIFRDGFE